MNSAFLEDGGNIAVFVQSIYVFSVSLSSSIREYQIPRRFSELSYGN